MRLENQLTDWLTLERAAGDRYSGGKRAKHPAYTADDGKPLRVRVARPVWR